MWNNVEYNPPPNVKPVLVYGEGCEVCFSFKIAESEDGEWFESGTGKDLPFKVTHWMYLPETP